MAKSWQDIHLEGFGLRRRLSEAERRQQATTDREEFDRARGAVSPMGGVAKPEPSRPGLKNR
jgi:hypothetical protein